MFHRVKSEVQDSEPAQEKENTPSYGQQNDRQEREESHARSYTPKAPKKEETPMRTQEDTQVQGKYSPAAATEDEAETSRTYQPSVARSSSYSASKSSYGNNASASQGYTAPAAPETPYSGNDRVLTIGRGINMSGEIEACDQLLVEGTVEAALKGAKILDIAESGTFYGTVEIEEALIAGRFEGDITVNGRLTIKETGVITGSIAYRELEVEAGAVLDGRMTPLKGTVDPKAQDKYRAGSDASAMAKAKAPASKKDNREPANTENALFSQAQTRY